MVVRRVTKVLTKASDETTFTQEIFCLQAITVRLRRNKKAQNLSGMCYKFFGQQLVTQGDFEHDFS